MSEHIITKAGKYAAHRHPLRKTTRKGHIRLTTTTPANTPQHLTIKDDERIVLDLSKEMAKGLLFICRSFALSGNGKRLGAVGVLLANALLDPNQFTKETT